MEGRFREAPVLTPLPVHPFELMLHVEQPEAHRPGDHHHGKLDEQIGLDADGHAHRDRDQEERSEEHTSELQSLAYLVCRLLLEKKKKEKRKVHINYRIINKK